jgi:hypothetical protein
MANKKKKGKASSKSSTLPPIVPIITTPKLLTVPSPSCRTQTLLDTVSSGDAVSVNRMVGSYGFQQNLKAVDINGATALHIATRKEDIAMLRKLLSYPGASDQVNALEDPRVGGFSVVHIACSNGNIDILQLLIEAGANINLKSKSSLGETPLHVCCKHGHAACAKMLLAAGAVADPRDSFGHNPSFWAYTKSFGTMIKECSLPPIHRATVQDHLTILEAKHPRLHRDADSKKKKKRGKSADGKKKKKK